MDNMDIVGDTMFRNFEVEYVIDDKRPEISATMTCTK